MPKQVSDQEFESLLTIIRQLEGAVSIEEIEARLDKKLPRRTLQHRLAHLVKQSKLIREGKGRASRYRLSKQYILHAESGQYSFRVAEVEMEAYLPLSLEGQQIKNAIQRPRQVRQPVGYARTFLDAYEPNKTFYLSQSIRHDLRAMGESPDAERPAGTYVKAVYSRLLIDLSYNSSRLEGNTYSLLETERLVDAGQNAEGKDVRESQMILNHKAAIEMLVDHAEETAFNRYTILNLHSLLSDNLLADPQAGGRLRRRPVSIDGTVFHPLEIPQLIEECFEKILDTVTAIDDPFEQAFFVMVHLPYLQPFDDVNKRVSRLAANIPMIRENLCPLSFVDVRTQAYIDGLLGVYELNRVELLRDVFVWAYQRSCARYSAIRQSMGEPDTFRLKHRDVIAQTVIAIVHGGMDKGMAIRLIRERAQELMVDNERARFVEVVETEVMNLHLGNIARYRLRPSEFHDWQMRWH